MLMAFDMEIGGTIMENDTQSKKQTATAVLFIIVAALNVLQILLSRNGSANAALLGLSIVAYVIIVAGLLQNKKNFPTAAIGFILLAGDMLWTLVNWVIMLTRYNTGMNAMALVSGVLPTIALDVLSLASYVLIVILYFFAAYGWTTQRRATPKFVAPIFICRLLIVIITGIEAGIAVAAAVMAGGNMTSGTEWMVPNALLTAAIAVLMMVGMRKAARAAAK